MKFGIDIGHNLPCDRGANGVKPEDFLCMEVGLKVIEQLKAAGHQVTGCRPASSDGVNHSLKTRVSIADKNRVDIFASIHFNAYDKSAHGTEVYAISSRGKKIASNIASEIETLGFYNRGVKNGSYLYVVKNTRAPAVLIECCFCDSEQDMELYDPDKMAQAIVKGLIHES